MINEYIPRQLPKPNKTEIDNIIKDAQSLNRNDPAWHKTLKDLAERAASEMESLLHHGKQNEPEFCFDDLHQIVADWEAYRQNNSLT